MAMLSTATSDEKDCQKVDNIIPQDDKRKWQAYKQSPRLKSEAIIVYKSKQKVTLKVTLLVSRPLARCIPFHDLDLSHLIGRARQLDKSDDWDVYIDAWRVAKATVLTLFYYTVDLAGNAGDNFGP